MASRKWKSASSRKDILDRKAYYMGRYQAKAITEANLVELRRSLMQAKKWKTRIRMSPLGFSFGTKPAGLLNTDKVMYQFIPLDDIETLRLDSIIRNVLLCIFRIDHNRNNIQNGHVDAAVAQHYEINAFQIDPRDAVLFQRNHDEFKSWTPMFQQNNGEPLLTSRVSSHGHIADDTDGWKTARDNNNTLSAAPTRSERDLRKRHHSSGDAYRHSAPIPRVLSPDITDSSSSTTFVYSGVELEQPSYGYRHQLKSYDVAIGPMYPADSNTILTSANGHSFTARVYFHRNLPMADVETQLSSDLSPIARTYGNESASRSTTSSGPSTSNFRSASSNQSTIQSGYNTKDSVKRRIQDLSREMEQLRTMVDAGEEGLPNQNGIDDIEEESSTTSGSTIQPRLATRINPPPSNIVPQGHTAGTVDTRLGKVDVVVDQAPYSTNHQNSRNRRPHQDGYLSESQTFTHDNRNRVRRHTSDQSRASTEVAGRYVFYRPVPEPQQAYRREQGRPRSVEPQSNRRRIWLK